MFRYFLFQVFQKFRRNFRPVLAKTSTWWRRDAGIVTKTFAIRVSMLIRLPFCSQFYRSLKKLFNCCSVLTFIWNHCKNRIRLRDRFVKFDQTQRQQQLTINQVAIISKKSTHFVLKNELIVVPLFLLDHT